MKSKEIKNSLDETYCTLSYDEELKAIVDVWTGPLGAQDNFKKAIREWLTMLEEIKCKKALTDLTRLVGSFDGSREWMFTEIVPKALKTGWQYHAMIQPQNIFTKLSAKDYVMNINGIEIRQFGNLEDARKWLKSIN